MASIIKKRKKGRFYYYAVKSQRVNGKPRIVWQKYLGTVEGIVEKIESTKPPPPKETVLWNFGGVTALLGITQQLGLMEIINRQLPKRNQGPTTGHYLILAALNRALEPCSKVQIGHWYQDTVLQRLWGFKPEAFSSQRFWDQMSLCGEEALHKIEGDLLGRIMEVFHVDSQCLLYDTTNFFTFIDTYNDRSNLAQRGNSKAKRHDLRQVGLALIVSRSFGIPLFHRVYPGNVNDQKVFSGVISEMVKTYRRLMEAVEDVTLVFDKGCSSYDNLDRLQDEKVHFVAALGIQCAGQLLEEPLEKFKISSKLAGVRSYRTSGEFFGHERTMVVSYSESFFAKQLAGVTNRMVKCERQLKSLSGQLEKHRQGKIRGRKPTSDGVREKIKEILNFQFMKDLFTVEVTEAEPVQVNYRLNHDYFSWLTEHRLGKTVLVSDQESWTDDEIISAYRGQDEVEKAFRHLKNIDFLHWQPAYHWTDQKLKVHGFYCVLGLTLAALARKSVVEAGIDMTIEKLLGELEEIKETAVIYPPGTLAHRKDHITLARMTSLQKKIASILNIAQFQIEVEG